MSHTYREQPGAIVVPAGRYFASLANNSERIESIDAIGRVIHSVQYDDAWHDSTDGSGHSLTIIDPANVDVNAWSQESAWRPNTHIDGSPGANS